MAATDDTFVFGSFRLIPAQRVLLEEGRPLRLGSRALDILAVLVARPGETVRKDDLIARVWPDTVIDEGALRVHVSALRKALGDGRAGHRYIVSVPGQGYSFVAPVARESAPADAAPADYGSARNNLPASLTRTIGRDEVTARLVAQLGQRRFLTIVGPGGIGKTTVAIDVARTATAGYPDGVWFVALGSIADPELVPTVLATTLGVSLPIVNPVNGLADWLRRKRTLLVFDNCEHVIDAVAAVAETILRAAPEVHILATSREPMRAEGEWLHRLAALDLPPESGERTVAALLRYSAVQLFDERARASLEGFDLTDGDADAVLEICRRLDGLPLAIELAAARVDAFGVRGLAKGLDQRFALLAKGRRTVPRHQTLRATLDWSHDLLTETERIVLRRLSVMHGRFTGRGAAGIAADEALTAPAVLEALENLAMKSLVSTDVSGHTIYHHLLETTRAFSLEKLIESGEVERVRRRHAEWYCALLARAEAERETLGAAEWLAEYAPRIDNVRAALDWAYSPGGDASIGRALSVAAVPLWIALSLLEECRGNVERALAHPTPESAGASRDAMKLHAALGAALLFTRGPTSDAETAWSQALEIGEMLADAEYQLLALWGLWVVRMNRGEFGVGLTLAQRFQDLAVRHGDPAELPIAERMIGVSLHYRGDQPAARRHIDRMLANYRPPTRRSPSARFLYDHRIVARVALARILWLQGSVDEASRVAQETVDDARGLHHAVMLCFALAEAASPVALFCGDLSAAERYIALLLETASQHSLQIWRSWGHRFRGALMIQRGEVEAGLDQLRASLDRPPESNFQPRFTWFLGQMAQGLSAVGRDDQALAAVDEALARCERNDDRWCLAELLRIKGDLLAQNAQVDRTTIEDLFTRSLAWAREQQALSWELRTAMSLARFSSGRNGGTQARELLAATYSRFAQGFSTVDLMSAKGLLAELP